MREEGDPMTTPDASWSVLKRMAVGVKKDVCVVESDTTP